MIQDQREVGWRVKRMRKEAEREEEDGWGINRGIEVYEEGRGGRLEEGERRKNRRGGMRVKDRME